MGTYTTNYNLFMPSIGEQGWGELVNNNFSIIDTTMNELNTRMGTAETNITSLTTRMGTAETTIASNKSRIGTLETDTNAVEARVGKIENKLGDGEFIRNVTFPIYAKVSGVNQGYGCVLPANSNTFAIPVGFDIANYTDVQNNITIRVSPGSGSNNQSGTIVGVNVINGNQRTLGTWVTNTGGGNNHTVNGVRVVERIGVIGGQGTAWIASITRPALYLNKI